MFGIPTFDILSDAGKQEFIEYIVNITRKEINSYTPSYNQGGHGSTSVSISSSGTGVPTGTITMYAGTTRPSGYLWCDGSQQLISSYVEHI